MYLVGLHICIQQDDARSLQYQVNNSCLTGTGWEGLDWIHLARGRDNWWAVVNMIIFDSMQCREFVDSLKAYSLPENVSGSWS